MEAERRAALVRMRQAAAEEGAANEQRRRQLAEAQEMVAKRRVKRGCGERSRHPGCMGTC